MSNDPARDFAAIEAEEVRLRERLEKIAQYKEAKAKADELARELGITGIIGAAPSGIPTTSDHFPWENDKLGHTFNGLIREYFTHPDSGFHALKHRVKQDYQNQIKHLEYSIGGERIRSWDAKRIQREYDENWAADGKLARGHAFATKLRLLLSFGSVTLNDDDCTRLSAILGNMRFPQPEARKVVLTLDHVRAFRATANQLFGWSSMALAQALMFYVPALKQSDVIGEWVPISEPGPSDITKDGEKWVRGLRWSDIDENMVLRKTIMVGRKSKDIEIKLTRKGPIVEEINRVPEWKRKGPLVICEFSDLPWTASEFRRKWRMVADKAGIPAEVKSMDSGRAFGGRPKDIEEEESRADAAL